MSPDRTLLDIFAAEQTEHVQRLRALVRMLDETGAQPFVYDEMLRRAHTLKGAARAVGLEQTEALTHRMEGVVQRMRDGSLAANPETRGVLHQVLDSAEDILAGAIEQTPRPDDGQLTALLDRLLGNQPQPPRPSQNAGAAAPPNAGPANEYVRVSATHLDDLIRTSSQMAAATALSAADHQIDAHAENLAEAAREWVRLRRDCAAYVRKHAQEADFEPVAESLAYIDGELRGLLAQARLAAADRQQRNWELRQRTEELHQNAFQLRMTPAESVFGAFGAMLRDLARQEGKQIEFRTEGLEVQADRLVLQALKDPVMHLLRNAVSHGIEPERERAAVGKPPAGSIRLQIESRGDRLRITVEDDGRGLNSKAVAAEAIKRGLLTEASLAAQSAEELAKLIFQPGFSTTKVITNLSGRGMGLSVVQQEVSRLQGEIKAGAGTQGGTRISIQVPLSISTQHVLLLGAGEYVFGIPAAFVERLCREKRSAIQSVGGRQSILVEEQPVPVGNLSELLGVPTDPRETEAEALVPIAVLTSAGERAALIVDRLVDEREVLVKDVGLPASMTGLSAGAVPLEDGTVAVMLNVADLLVRFHETGNEAGPKLIVQASKKKMARILVVDDSITTRSLEKTILEANGYQVEVAVDGQEALEKARAMVPDLVITDVMMPRMDGYELLEALKKEKDMAHIPVIMVTSLERREEQERGLALGADAYIVKRKFDQRELLRIVRQIL